MPVLRKTSDGQISIVYVLLCFLFLVIVCICFRWKIQSSPSHIGSSYRHGDLNFAQPPETIRNYESGIGELKLRGQIIVRGASRRNIRVYGRMESKCASNDLSSQYRPTWIPDHFQKLNSRDMEDFSDTERKRMFIDLLSPDVIKATPKPIAQEIVSSYISDKDACTELLSYWGEDGIEKLAQKQGLSEPRLPEFSGRVIEEWRNGQRDQEWTSQPCWFRVSLLVMRC